jgi:hypothetical protein
MAEKEMEEKCQELIKEDQSPDEWLEPLKLAVTELFLVEQKLIVPEVKDKKKPVSKKGS